MAEYVIMVGGKLETYNNYNDIPEQIEKAEVIKIVTTRDEKGKFGRILGTLVADNGDNINAYMIRHNYAVHYQGQNKDDVQKEHLSNRVILNERGEMNKE